MQLLRDGGGRELGSWEEEGVMGGGGEGGKELRGIQRGHGPPQHPFPPPHLHPTPYTQYPGSSPTP